MTPDTPHPDEFEEPTPDSLAGEDAAVPYDPEERGAAAGVEATRRRLEHELLPLDGIEGVGVAKNASGDPALVVYVRYAAVGERVPSTADGFDVLTIVTGEIDALSA